MDEETKNKALNSLNNINVNQSPKSTEQVILDYIKGNDDSPDKKDLVYNNGEFSIVAGEEVQDEFVVIKSMEPDHFGMPDDCDSVQEMREFLIELTKQEVRSRIIRLQTEYPQLDFLDEQIEFCNSLTHKVLEKVVFGVDKDEN